LTSNNVDVDEKVQRFDDLTKAEFAKALQLYIKIYGWLDVKSIIVVDLTNEPHEDDPFLDDIETLFTEDFWERVYSGVI
jgi:hypothetical protein